ncbi:MAG: GNAT family N-acetyltransferase [Gillisia sp.]
MKSLSIKKIPASETISVRQTVLRPGKPVSDCEFEGDYSPESFHLGIFYHNNLAGVGSFIKMSNPLFTDLNQFRIRGMAILPQFQKHGFGKKILKEGETEIAAISQTPLIWFNARETAIGFYEKFGYKTQGEKFDIPGVCTHIVMYKKL